LELGIDASADGDAFGLLNMNWIPLCKYLWTRREAKY